MYKHFSLFICLPHCVYSFIELPTHVYIIRSFYRVIAITWFVSYIWICRYFLFFRFKFVSRQFLVLKKAFPFDKGTEKWQTIVNETVIQKLRYHVTVVKIRLSLVNWKKVEKREKWYSINYDRPGGNYFSETLYVYMQWTQLFS